MVSRVVGSRPSYRANFGGALQITGTTKVLGSPTNLPVRRRVRLHDQRTGLAVAQMWSDAVTGTYTFGGLSAGTYYVTAFDHTGAYGGVIETDLVPEVPA